VSVCGWLVDGCGSAENLSDSIHVGDEWIYIVIVIRCMLLLCQEMGGLIASVMMP